MKLTNSGNASSTSIVRYESLDSSFLPGIHEGILNANILQMYSGYNGVDIVQRFDKMVDAPVFKVEGANFDASRLERVDLRL